MLTKSEHFCFCALILCGVCAAFNASAEDYNMQRIASTATRLPVEGKLPALDGATAWLNSSPLRTSELRGKVVLVQFWTYTCVNWRRTLPYVRAWAEKYKDRGLVVIGVHTPEFSFERDLDNVRRAVREQRVDYPVAIDTDYAIWGAFENQYWPALYFVDAQGHIRHHQFGEGEYEQSELVIQHLLAEAGHGPLDTKLVSVDPMGAEVAADWKSVRSPESYVGRDKAENFVSTRGVLRPYALPAHLRLNEWGLAGEWTLRSEYALLNKPNGRIVYRFHARDLNLVMGTSARGNAVRFRVTIDGHPPYASHGVDIDETGLGSVDEPRLYQLIRQQGSISDRLIEIEFLDAGAEVFDFTFG